MKKFLLIISVLTLVLLLPSTVKADTSIGITPPYIQSQKLLPGSTYRQDLILSKTGSTNDVTVEIDTSESDIASWLSFEPSAKFDWGKDENQKKITAIVKVPQDAQLKEYNSAIRIKMGEKNAKGQVVLVPGVRIDIKLTVVNVKISNLEVRSARIEDFKANEPLKLVLLVKNDGNSADKLKSVTLNITDLNSNVIQTIEAQDSNIPTVKEFSTEEIVILFPDHGIGEGQYFAELKTTNNQNISFETKISFNINQVPQATSSSQETEKNKLLSSSYLYYAIVFIIVLTAILLYIFFVLKKKKRNEPENPSLEEHKPNLEAEKPSASLQSEPTTATQSAPPIVEQPTATVSQPSEQAPVGSGMPTQQQTPTNSPSQPNNVEENKQL